jgi:hypothetical protein
MPLLAWEVALRTLAGNSSRGGGKFLTWEVQPKEGGGSWKVLYLDGEQHLGDIQERAHDLLDAAPILLRPDRRWRGERG